MCKKNNMEAFLYFISVIHFFPMDFKFFSRQFSYLVLIINGTGFAMCNDKQPKTFRFGQNMLNSSLNDTF